MGLPLNPAPLGPVRPPERYNRGVPQPVATRQDPARSVQVAQRPAGPRGSSWAVGLGVTIITLIVFWPALHGQFLNWDDDQNFLNNPHFRGLDPSNLRWMFTTFHLGHYHPLTWLTLGLDYSLWGMDPKGYHFTNLILHTAGAAVFYLVALRLLGRRILAAGLAALLFAIHPLRVESVAWVSERRDVLSGLLYLLSALAYLKAHQNGPRRRWIGLSLVAFAAGLLSKVIVVSLPVALLALDACVLGRLKRGQWFSAETRGVWLEKLPYFLLGLAAAVTALALNFLGLAGFAEHVALMLPLRAGLSIYGLAFYLWKTMLPVGLYPQYVMATEIVPTDPRILWSGVVVAALTVVVIVLRRRYPALLAAWICYAAGLLPVLSIARVDPQQYVADHHTYLATLGFALVAAAGLASLPERVFRTTAAIVVLALGALSYNQIAVWHDSLSLWTRTLAGSPDSVVAHNNVGELLANQRRLAEAIPHFERAVAIKPKHAQSHYNLGHARQQQGHLDAAVKHFRAALEIEPRFSAAHNDLANCYAQLGRFDAAIEHYRQALRYRPQFADAHYNLGNLLQQQGRPEQAISHYERAALFDPANANVHNNWGVALDALRRPADAMGHYQRALALDPRNADAHNNMGVSLETAGKTPEALQHFREALRWNPAHRDAAANLARLQNRAPKQ